MVGQGDCPTLPAPINVLTLDGIKAVLVVLNDAETEATNAGWGRLLRCYGYWADTETTPTAACDGAINVCQSGAGVEGPEHTAARSSQLAAVRPAWWEDAVANSAAEVGSIIDVIGGSVDFDFRGALALGSEQGSSAVNNGHEPEDERDQDDCYVTALNHFAEDDAYVSLTAVERDKYINVDTPKVYSGPTSSESEAEQRDYWKRNFIDEIMAQTAASKNDPQGDIHTPSFDEDEVDWDRDLLAPVIEEEIDQMEAWRRFRGELTLGSFALQAIAFGYTPGSFKAEINEIDMPLGTGPEQVKDGHDAEAVQLYERCLTSAQLSKDAALEGSACHKLGLSKHKTGHYEFLGCMMTIP
ncbi:Hypothetical protein SCF082_LOCUS14977 [Durusdinium trenchii]|uniref:Uncharacterized protein n=1 Tax=Durusdinium trenchii TaxID=1381693 RepID=A0ABP0K1J1_9DINO